MARKTKVAAEETRNRILTAAREAFCECGVRQVSLENIASRAGLTRGAVYWHFNDKKELFNAVREDVLAQIIEECDALLESLEFEDPLDAIEAALQRFFQIFDERPRFRTVLEILFFRCEKVGEFAGVQDDLYQRSSEFWHKLYRAYERASLVGTLSSRLAVSAAAWDTLAFTYGVMDKLLLGQLDVGKNSSVATLISSHVALRKKVIQ